MSKAAWGGEGLFDLHFRITVYCQRTSDRNSKGWILEAGADTEALEGCCLTLVSHDLLSLLSYGTQEHLPWGSTTHRELDINN